MSIRQGKVTYKDQIVGILEETPMGGTKFSYSDSWDGNPVACTLNKKYIEWNGGLHPFFQNLCPEGWLRDKQREVGRIDTLDDFGFILHFGKDCIGAVGIISSSETKNISVAQDAITASISSNKTISGVQEKLLVYKELDKFYPSKDGDLANYIAKFNNNTYPDLIRNERRCLDLAQLVLGKDKVTKFSLGTLIDNRVALMVERFDRNNENKLRMEEFAQILNKTSREKYEGSYEAIALEIMQHSSLPEVDLLLYFKQVVFNMLIGNTDAHLKNFALLETRNGMRLSPAYDLVNTILYQNQGHDSRLALFLAEEKMQWSTVDRKILSHFGSKIGLKDQAIKQAFNDIKKGIVKNREVLKSASTIAPDSFSERYQEIIESTFQRILSE